MAIALLLLPPSKRKFGYPPPTWVSRSSPSFGRRPPHNKISSLFSLLAPLLAPGALASGFLTPLFLVLPTFLFFCPR